MKKEAVVLLKAITAAARAHCRKLRLVMAHKSS